MFVLGSYAVAVVFCVITMLCWGSWANTQSLAGKRWRFELFYWDYVFGVLLASTIFAFTLGSFGSSGRSFLADLAQADWANLGSAMLGGVIFNAGNILLVASIAIAGMAIAFPVGIGLALVLGVLVNYWAEPTGNAAVLFAGVAFIVMAIVLDAMAYRRLRNQSQSGVAEGLVLALLCGVLLGCFFRFLAAAMPKPDEFAQMPAGKISPYTAIFCSSVGMLLNNFVFNTAIMLKPFTGTPVPLLDYFKGTLRDHLWGIAGGMIWAVGTTFSVVASGKAGFAISYGLGQGAAMVAAFWGVFVWKEFRQAPPGTDRLLWLMFAGYLVGLTLVVVARTA